MLGVVVNPTITAVDEVYRKVAEEMGVGHTFARTPVGVFFGRDGARSPASRSMTRSSAASGRAAPAAWRSASA